jgi:hypothetical protein
MSIINRKIELNSGGDTLVINEAFNIRARSIMKIFLTQHIGVKCLFEKITPFSKLGMNIEVLAKKLLTIPGQRRV